MRDFPWACADIFCIIFKSIPGVWIVPIISAFKWTLVKAVG